MKSRKVWYLVDTNTKCWNCTYAPSRDGYCQKWNGERLIAAHRYSYEKVKGKIPDGLVLDHLCRNVKCVNPEHLEPVTLTENTRRGNMTKLNLEKVAQIKSKYSSGEYTQVELSKEFGVGQDQVSRIINEIAWK